MTKPVPKRKILVAGVSLAMLAASLVLSVVLSSPDNIAEASNSTSATASATATGPTVKSPVAVGRSKPLRDLVPARTASTMPPAYRLGESESLLHPTGNGSFFGDTVVQSSIGGAAIPPTSQNFDGAAIGEELERRRLHRRAAGHERRRRAEPLRADGQHRLHDLLQDGSASRRTDAAQRDLAERAERRSVQLHVAEPRRPDRAVRPSRRPLADQPVQLPGRRRDRAALRPVHRDFADVRSHGRLLPLRLQLQRDDLQRLSALRRVARRLLHVGQPVRHDDAEHRLPQRRRLRIRAGEDVDRRSGSTAGLLR